MRLVIDTNVVVSALWQPRGNPGRVFTMLQRRALVPLYDARILAEYREVTARPRFRFRPLDVEHLLGELERRGERLEAVPAAVFALPDPDDQPFLDVAIAGRADAIVTGNRKDFPEACGARVLSPAEIVEILAPR